MMIRIRIRIIINLISYIAIIAGILCMLHMYLNDKELDQYLAFFTIINAIMVNGNNKL